MLQPKKLLKDLYSVTAHHTAESGTQHQIDITINANHRIFEGHFPGHPVMPGVAMLQIVKELTESITGKKLFMEKCTNVKFLALIEPDGPTTLNLSLDISPLEEGIRVKNTTTFKDTTALRLTAFYKEIH